jgi:IclR family transcriptional regulator, KDG regulon repressor
MFMFSFLIDNNKTSYYFLNIHFSGADIEEIPVSARGKDSYSIQSVEHALDLLEALCEDEEELRISHLSEKLKMNKTSVFRLLATFEHRGYVERERGSGKYRLGLSAYETGRKILSRMELLRQARPVMERLARDCKEAAYLSVRRGTEILFLEMADCLLQVKIVPLIGRRYPLMGNSAGNVMLAFSQENSNWSPGAAAIDSKAAEEIAATRTRGFSCDWGGLGEGIATMSVPLFDGSTELAGCLSLVGPEFRMPRNTMEIEFYPRLKEAGEIISSKLGYLGHYFGKEPS